MTRDYMQVRAHGRQVLRDKLRDRSPRLRSRPQRYRRLHLKRQGSRSTAAITFYQQSSRFTAAITFCSCSRRFEWRLLYCCGRMGEDGWRRHLVRACVRACVGRPCRCAWDGTTVVVRAWATVRGRLCAGNCAWMAVFARACVGRPCRCVPHHTSGPARFTASASLPPLLSCAPHHASGPSSASLPPLWSCTPHYLRLRLSAPASCLSSSAVAGGWVSVCVSVCMSVSVCVSVSVSVSVSVPCVCAGCLAE